jgi:hypothetical protein
VLHKEGCSRTSPRQRLCNEASGPEARAMLAKARKGSHGPNDAPVTLKSHNAKAAYALQVRPTREVNATWKRAVAAKRGEPASAATLVSAARSRVAFHPRQERGQSILTLSRARAGDVMPHDLYRAASKQPDTLILSHPHMYFAHRSRADVIVNLVSRRARRALSVMCPTRRCCGVRALRPDKAPDRPSSNRTSC